MLHYASDVVRASTLVLEGMTRAPGAAGIARAYLAHREVVEAAYVRWCGAVGGWFVPDEGDPAQVVRKRRSRTAVAMANVNEGEEVAPGHALRRSTTGWRRSSLGLAGTGAVAAPLEEERTAPRPHAVRDLAILPTQRVTRYVLLYRGASVFLFLSAPLADLAQYRPPSTYAPHLARPRTRRARGRRCVARRGKVQPRAGKRSVHCAGACRRSWSRWCGARGERRELEQPRVNEWIVTCLQRPQLDGGVVCGDHT